MEENVSLSSASSSRNLDKEKIFTKKKVELREDLTFVNNIDKSFYLYHVNRLIKSTMTLHDWLNKRMSSLPIGNVLRKFTEKIGSVVLSPLDHAVRLSLNSIKISSSKTSIKKLDEIIKKDFSDIAFNENTSRLKTITELQQEKESLLIKLRNLQIKKDKLSLESTKLRTSLPYPMPTKLTGPTKLKRPALFAKKGKKKSKKQKNTLGTLNNNKNDIQTIENTLGTLNNNKNDIQTIENTLENLNNKVKRLSELSLILELKMSNKNRIFNSSVLLVHSLVTLSADVTLFAVSSLASIAAKSFVSLVPKILLWNDRVLNYSEIGTIVLGFTQSVYLNTVKIRRAHILMNKIENFQKEGLLTHSKLGAKPLNQSDIDLLDEHLKKIYINEMNSNSTKLNSEDLSNLHNILSNIGKTFITNEQLKTLESLLRKMNRYRQDTTRDLIKDLMNRIKNYRNYISPIIISRLGENPLSSGEINALKMLGYSAREEKLLSSIGSRFITADELGELKCFFDAKKLQLKNGTICTDSSKLDTIKEVINRFDSYFNDYYTYFITNNSVTPDGIVEVINNNDLFSAYQLMLQAKSKAAITSALHESWISRLNRKNFNTAYANYSLKIYDYINENFKTSLASKNDLFTVKDNEWGKVWKLFHPYRTDDLKERALADNHKFLLSLIGPDSSYLNRNLKKIDWNDPKKVNELYEQYSQCGHLRDYINALLSGSNVHRYKFYDNLIEHVERPENISTEDALNIIQSQV